MPLLKYRITVPTVILILQGDRLVAHTIGKNAIITTDSEKAPGPTNLIEILWDGQAALMFMQDLRSRGELVLAAV